MFGRKQCLPIDLLFGTNTAELKGSTSTKSVENLKWRTEWAYKTANEVIKKEQEDKIQDRWENTIYKVIEQPMGKIPVFFFKLNPQEITRQKWYIGICC